MTDEIASVNSGSAPVEQAQTSQPTQTQDSFDISRYFSEDLRKDPEFERISKNLPNDPYALVKDVYHKTKHFGKVRDVIKSELEAEINKPQTFKPEDYSYQLPEAYEIEDEIQAAAKAKAQELGIKPEQFKSLMESILQTDASLEKTISESRKQAEAQAVDSLKGEWGSNYEKNLANAQKAWEYFTSPEDDKILESLDGPAKVLVSKVMAKVSERFTEPSIGKVGISSKSDAQSELNRIMSDKSHPYWNNDQNAIKQVFELQKRLVR